MGALVADPVSGGGMYIQTSFMTPGTSPDIMALLYYSGQRRRQGDE